MIMRWAMMLTMTVALAGQGMLKEIPFVGCPSDGQAGPDDPPTGPAKRVTVDEIPAIAFYKGEHAPGAFAPAGWHCRVWYGSSGSILVITPGSIDPPFFPPPTFQSDAVELSLDEGGTSGRYEVAEKAAQFFPSVAARFIAEVNTSLDKKIVVGGPPRYPNVRKLSDVSAEFTTPPNTAGLGTEGYLKPTQTPISGVVVLDTPDP